MKEKLLEKLKALSEELAALEMNNGAAWKARRKLDAAAAILKKDWPKEAAPAQEAAPANPANPAKETPAPAKAAKA